MVDELTLDDWARFQRYWRRHPPTHLLAAAYLKYEPREEGDDPARQQQSLEARWKAGVPNVKQLFEMGGGVIALRA